ncbi:MAG: hypothetical protein C0626_13545 [Arcobacter sp.]|uniref:hypothetical protein n=1 Tax=uncultured Arcobacter sp. TaxID=165434 RepID=UPI000CC4F46F|nr:hypothetical protein [uncultured Arcobacter sp.]PLY08225.1 MAG: hypothetical protein C0626_13545 [Arcobacter sp.]
MKSIFYLLLISVLLFANESEPQNSSEFIKKESSVFDTSNSIQAEELKTSYFEEIINYESKNDLKEKNIYLSYKSFPQNIFKNQRFEIILKAIITADDYDKIETRFINSKNMNVLNPESSWEEIEDKTFENKFYFKAYEDSFVMPTFQVAIYKNLELIEVQNIAPQEVAFSEIGKNINNFSSVIAKDLVINAHKTKQYNNDELITIMDINAVESNLEDFAIKGVEEQGISKIDDNYPEQNLLYYLVLPVHTKKLDFSYYNSFEKKFITIKIPIVLENELVSTQTDLNPNKSNILLYKRVALGGLFALFLIIYIWKRKKIYLILTLIACVGLLIYSIPNKTSTLKKDSYIYILPTKKSTIFQKTNKDYLVEVSIKRGDFVKIIVEQGDKSMIGWVKEDDLNKN